MIGNPAFSASPQEVASVVARLNRPEATLVAQARASGGAATLGYGRSDQSKRLQVPRDWVQYAELEQLVAQARRQLEGLGWSVRTLTNQWAVEEAALGVVAPRILQFATHGYMRTGRQLSSPA